ncbi:MAG: response regulator [Chitinivibrionales bacterium]|nr:response regulator [Chitinivibrionales bacterium]
MNDPQAAVNVNTDTIKKLTGKTKALLRAEIQCEKWVSWIRLGFGLIAAFLFIASYLIGNTRHNVFVVQIGTVAALLIYSTYYLIAYRNEQAKKYSNFLLVFFDVTVASYIIWSFPLNASSYTFLNSSVFSLYFIALAFTALHHRARLSIFGGIVAALEFSTIYFFLWFPLKPPQESWIADFCIRIAALLTVAIMSGIISRNNFRAIQKMISSEIRFQNLVHRLPELLCTLDYKGNFIWANMASNTILGIPPKALEGRNIKEFMIAPEELSLKGERIRRMFEIKDFEGNRKFVDSIIRPSQQTGGGIGWECIMADVTDKEIAISQREEMVNRLFQYQKMESLGTLASGMAHDFNNILQTEHDIVEFVQKDTKEPETRKRMDLLAETLADARFLTSELLALGRKQPLDYKSLNLVSFIENVVPFFREQISSDFEIQVKMHDQQLWIQADADYLKRIFQNLIGNARDAMPGGGRILIEGKAVRKQSEANTIVLRFSDNGVGMSPDLTEKIFDPFFSTKKPGKGTGLGLALVRRIVTLHNGQVFVEKTDSHGTTFRLEFPESSQEDLDLDTKHIMLNRLSSRVLLLDDDVKIRDILKIFVKGLGYTACESATKDEAERELKRYREDCNVIIMDWKLGNDDPHQVIASLRKIKPELIVLVVSGYPPKQKSIRSMQIHKWFTKPYDKNLLDLEIQKALHRMDKNGETRVSV